ncbi:MAG: thiolase family protein [Candidatus Odinarchaeota archaeon]
MKQLRETVIVDAIRTPIGRKDRAFAHTRPDELASHVLREITKRTKVNPKDVDDVMMGCNTQTAWQGANIGRLALLGADFPYTVPGCSINRACGSSQQAVNFAAQSISTYNADIVIAAGVEHMSWLPIGADFGEGYAVFNPELVKKYQFIPMPMSAERMAEKYDIPREDLDKFALWSHQKAVAAWNSGKFANEVVPIKARQEDGSFKLIEKDESPRPNTSLEKLATLPPLFGGKITAGNCCPINDGAAAVMLMSREKADELNLKPRAIVKSQAVVGTEPVMCLEGPIFATPPCLKRANLTIDELDAIEVNEAFSSVVIAAGKMLGFDPLSDSRLNVHGGSIALGHPLGASGARVITTLLNVMEDSNGRFGLATFCCGLGLGTATIIEREK